MALPIAGLHTYMKLIFLHHLNYKGKFIYFPHCDLSRALRFACSHICNNQRRWKVSNLGGQTLIQHLLMKQVLLLDKGQTISKANYSVLNFSENWQKNHYPELILSIFTIENSNFSFVFWVNWGRLNLLSRFFHL